MFLFSIILFVLSLISTDSTTKLFNLFTTNSKSNPSNDLKRTFNEQQNQSNSSFTDNDNPFLHAPFHFTHRSPTHKQIPQAPIQPTNHETISTSQTSAFDPTSIVVGKRLSAFAPYQRQEPNTGNNGKYSGIEKRKESIFNIQMIVDRSLYD